MNAVRSVGPQGHFALVALVCACWVGAALETQADQAAPADELSVQELAVAEGSGPVSTAQPATEDAQSAVLMEEPADATAASPIPVAEDESLGRPTHKQVGIIDVNAEELEDLALKCFCLAPNGNVLAACGEGPGEVRVFNPDGQFLNSWTLSIRPEAINVGSDGNIYVAGAGSLLKLDAEGRELLRTEAPHLAAIKADPEKLRQEVIEQLKQTAESVGEQLKQYEQMIATIEEKEEADRTAEEVQQLKMLQQIQEQYEKLQKQYGGELTDEQIDKQVQAMIDYKSRIASIGESNGSVFLATGQVEGYGYSVWRTNSNFGEAKDIVHDLSGCCGQMDVQCCDSGVYVAENSRHRVVRYDADGKQIISWGKSARSGLHDFGGCCNPMNLAFGSDGSVYTAESDTGRIKQYSPEGELLSLVGKVDLVPGCKKVAIGVAPDGGHIYMLDITKNRILIMDRLKAGETVAYHETNDKAAGGLLGALKSLFGL